MKRVLCGICGLIAVVLAAGASSASRAQDAEPAPLSDADLAELRGGYMTAAGISFGFGMVVRTYVDNRLALRTTLQWTPDGAVAEQVRGDAPGAIDLTDALGALLVKGIDMGDLSDPQGLVLMDDGGVTALIHNIASGHIQTLVLNTADGRDLRQEMELNLVLPDLIAMQHDIALNRLGAEISGEINAASTR